MRTAVILPYLAFILNFLNGAIPIVRCAYIVCRQHVNNLTKNLKIVGLGTKLLYVMSYF